ncbi:MAG: hypothetical protein IT285_14970 [Bdellovibrionales bacterium]|nr:hypothetical protein [Bdellovibrionales bacterium]
MFILGHVGIGLKISKPFMGKGAGGLSWAWTALGTLLPDLIDKPLYYGLSLVTGLKGAELGLISGSRTMGHTLLFLMILLGFAVLRRSKAAAALALGAATHLVLDHLGDSVGSIWNGGLSVAFDWANDQVVGLLWPLLGNRFPVYPFVDGADHLLGALKPHAIAAEAAGALILAQEYRRGTFRNFLR